jgi:hypothetical protein
LGGGDLLVSGFQPDDLAGIVVRTRDIRASHSTVSIRLRVCGPVHAALAQACRALVKVPSSSAATMSAKGAAAWRAAQPAGTT